MLASIALAAIFLLLRSSHSDAQLGGVDAPDVMDFDAVLKKVGACEGDDSNAYTYKVLNPVLERISRETVALSCDLELSRDIPNDPSYSVEALIENVSDTDESKRITVATYSWPNICGELARGDKESFRNFRDSVKGDFVCPVKKGMHQIEKLLLTVKDVKPLMREGVMAFTMKHFIRGKCIGCSVVEFDVTIE